MVRFRVMFDLRLAQAYADYMATLDVLMDVRSIESSRVELWLNDEKDLTLAEKEFERFLQQPDHPRYVAASWQRGKTTLSLPTQSFSYWQVIRDGGGLVTHSVSLLCTLVYVLMLWQGEPRVMEGLAFVDGSAQQRVELWRWFTPALLHFSIQHILFNLVMWWYLGGRVEKYLGSRKLLLITLLSAGLSAKAQSLFSGVHFGGLSGVVYALIGYVWLYGERLPERGLTLPRAMMGLILIWFLVDYFDLLGPVANVAHLSGLMFGLLFAWWDTRSARGLKTD